MPDLSTNSQSPAQSGDEPENVERGPAGRAIGDFVHVPVELEGRRPVGDQDIARLLADERIIGAHRQHRTAQDVRSGELEQVANLGSAGMRVRPFDEGGDIVGQIIMTDDVQQIPRSEEHTSELQSLMRISYAVFGLKKKHTQN